MIQGEGSFCVIGWFYPIRCLSLKKYILALQAAHPPKKKKTVKVEITFNHVLNR